MIFVNMKDYMINRIYRQDYMINRIYRQDYMINRIYRQYTIHTELQIKTIPVRHWVLQVREFCQTYQLFARPTFFLEIF